MHPPCHILPGGGRQAPVTRVPAKGVDRWHFSVIIFSFRQIGIAHSASSFGSEVGAVDVLSSELPTMGWGLVDYPP
jgi:hypothetical protein